MTMSPEFRFRSEFLHRFVLVAAVVSFCCVLAGCPSKAPEGVHNITPVQLDEMRGQSDVLVIDVREPSELKSLPAVPEAQNIPLGQLAARAGELDKDNRIVLVCRSGNRSSQAARILQQDGFENIYNLIGGMKGYHAQKKK